MNDPLATYLHDHLGGARAAIDLLKAIHHRHQGEPLGDFAAVFLPEVEADRETLQRLAEKIAQLLIADFGAHWVRVSLAKPGKFDDVESVGVLIERRKPAREQHVTCAFLGEGLIPN